MENKSKQRTLNEPNRCREPSVGSSWVSSVFQLQPHDDVSFELSSQLMLAKLTSFL